MRLQFNNGQSSIEFWESDEERGRLAITYHKRHSTPEVHILEPEQEWGLFVSLAPFLDADMVWGLVRDRMTHKLYTLDNARKALARIECDNEGHEDFDEEEIREGHAGRLIKTVLTCPRCGARGEVI